MRRYRWVVLVLAALVSGCYQMSASDGPSWNADSEEGTGQAAREGDEVPDANAVDGGPGAAGLKPPTEQNETPDNGEEPLAPLDQVLIGEQAIEEIYAVFEYVLDRPEINGYVACVVAASALWIQHSVYHCTQTAEASEIPPPMTTTLGLAGRFCQSCSAFYLNVSAAELDLCVEDIMTLVDCDEIRAEQLGIPSCAWIHNAIHCG